MSEMRREEDGLELFFAAARTAPPVPSADFLALLAAQGAAVQAERVSAALAPPRRPLPAPGARGGVWAALAAALGGWGAMGGMATAAVAGLWIGLAGAPVMLQTVGLGGLGTDVASDTGTAFLPEADILALAFGE